MTRPPQVSVVIPTHDRLALLRRGLDVLLRDDACGEVVVVADGCSDGTDEHLRALAARDPRVRPVLAHPNVGVSQARRLGVEAATSDVVLCLDDDVVPAADLVTGHARAQAEGGRRVVLGYMPTRLPAPLGPGMYATREYVEVYEALVERFEVDPDLILGQFWAGNFSVRREDYLAVTQGAPDLVERHEDTELGLRLRDAGVGAVFDRSLRGDHEHSRSWATYLREGASLGRAAAELSRRHPADVPCTPWVLDAATNPGVRALMRVARLPGAAAPMTALLRGATLLAGRLGRFDVEKKLAHVAKDIAWHRAAASTVAAMAPLSP